MGRKYFLQVFWMADHFLLFLRFSSFHICRQSTRCISRNCILFQNLRLKCLLNKCTYLFHILHFCIYLACKCHINNYLQAKPKLYLAPKILYLLHYCKLILWWNELVNFSLMFFFLSIRSHLCMLFLLDPWHLYF